MDTITATPHRFNLEEAVFGYRNSIFKTDLKGKHVITAVQFRLTKKNHVLKTAYGTIQEELGNNVSSPKNIAEAVIAIRQRKLPDPKKIGNSGSFFKNPVVTENHFQKLLLAYPEMPHYRISDSEVKIPAGWIIDRLGYKGIKRGAAGVHEHQALVLVNHGNARGIEILSLAKEIQEKVLERFKIRWKLKLTSINYSLFLESN